MAEARGASFAAPFRGSKRTAEVWGTRGPEKSLTVTAYWLRTPHPEGLQARAREALGQALARGQLRVKLGLVVPLAEAATAHQQLETRATVGKVVLRVG